MAISINSPLGGGGTTGNSPNRRSTGIGPLFLKSKSTGGCHVGFGSLLLMLAIYIMGFFALSVWRSPSALPLDHNSNKILPPPEKLSKIRNTQQQQQQQQQQHQQESQQGKKQPLKLPKAKQEASNQKQQQPQIPPLPSDAQLCNFDGHCPIGTTCVGHPLSSKGGICQVYRPSTRAELLQSSSDKKESSSQQQRRFADCVQSCRSELDWDEHYYFYDESRSELNTIPKIHNTLPSIDISRSSRPPGCLLVFERVPGVNKTLLQTTKREDWLEARRAQHMLRVDPLIEAGDENNYHMPNKTFTPPALAKSGVLWTAFCYLPCQTDADCGGSSGGSSSFYCDRSRGGASSSSGVCDRNKTYWRQYNNASKTVLVTGANLGYWTGLVNFAASARFWAPDNPLVVYNLGLTEEQLATVATWSNVIAIEWKNGIPYKQSHVHTLHVYAWKSLAINESVHKYHNMFWLDAGATFSGPVDGMEHYLQRHGTFLVRGQDLNMYDKSHPDTYEYFHLNKETFVGGPHYAGGIQGHLLPSRYIETIVKPNAACAIDAACISPSDSNLGNHRYDQTSLSILAYGRFQQIPHHTEFLAATRSQLKADMTKPSSMFMWTARQGCSFYAQREDEAEAKLKAKSKK